MTPEGLLGTPTDARDAEESGHGAEPPMMDHDHDGIREYDNPLPAWWRAIFVGTVVFGGFYGLYFHVVGWGREPAASYRAALVSHEAKREQRAVADTRSVSEESLARGVLDGAIVSRGAVVFTARCASCHGPAGAGLIGPNLTDDRQLHGSSRMDLLRVVRGGAPGTAMIAWSEQLPAGDVVAATTFLITLRGKRLPGKHPEGVPVGAFSP